MPKKLRHKKECRLGHLKKDGSENVSSKPTELRAKINAPVTLREKMSSLWAEFRQKEVDANSQESLADAQDFDVDDDPFPSSPYEVEHEFADEIDYQLSQVPEVTSSGANNQGDNYAEETNSETTEQRESDQNLD